MKFILVSLALDSFTPNTYASIAAFSPVPTRNYPPHRLRPGLRPRRHPHHHLRPHSHVHARVLVHVVLWFSTERVLKKCKRSLVKPQTGARVLAGPALRSDGVHDGPSVGILLALTVIYLSVLRVCVANKPLALPCCFVWNRLVWCRLCWSRS